MVYNTDLEEEERARERRKQRKGERPAQWLAEAILASTVQVIWEKDPYWELLTLQEAQTLEK